MPYASFLRQNIFIPLGMTKTGVDVDSAILPERAQGYDSTPDGFRRAEPISMTVPFSAGFVYWTVEDLVKWERALFADKVITAASRHSMAGRAAPAGEYSRAQGVNVVNVPEFPSYRGANRRSLGFARDD